MPASTGLGLFYGVRHATFYALGYIVCSASNMVFAVGRTVRAPLRRLPALLSPLRFDIARSDCAGTHSWIPYSLQVWFSIGGYRAARAAFVAIATGVVKSPMSFFETTPTGRILNRLTYDVGAKQGCQPPRPAAAARRLGHTHATHPPAPCRAFARRRDRLCPPGDEPPPLELHRLDPHGPHRDARHRPARRRRARGGARRLRLGREALQLHLRAAAAHRREQPLAAPGAPRGGALRRADDPGVRAARPLRRHARRPGRRQHARLPRLHKLRPLVRHPPRGGGGVRPPGRRPPLLGAPPLHHAVARRPRARLGGQLHHLAQLLLPGHHRLVRPAHPPPPRTCFPP